MLLQLPEVAAASREFTALGRSVNTLGGLTTGGLTRPLSGVQQSTGQSLRKVVLETQKLTQALNPTMADWRQRLSWMTQRFDAIKAKSPPAQLPRPAASDKEVSRQGHISARSCTAAHILTCIPLAARLH